MKPKRTSKKRVFIVTAVICIIAAFSITAYAVNLFSLRDLVLNRDIPSPSPSPVYTDGDDGVVDGPNGGDVEYMPPQGLEIMEMISLQGYAGSDEYKAAAEWLAFTDSYDTDGSILASIGNGPTGLDEKYNLYNVYTQDMADKLDEITSKYSLKLHSEIIDVESRDSLIATAANGDFLGDNIPYSTYMYEDGTFHFDGDTVFSNGVESMYQFMSCKKGSFTDVLLNIGSADDYIEWSYKTTSGVTVSLSMSPYKSLIIAETETSFITVNILAGGADWVGTDDLEAFADTFDFSQLK